MAYDINAALESLERNLSEVSSAKMQVEETIATSESLQQIIGQYSDSLSSLNDEVSAFVAEVRNFQGIESTKLESAVNNLSSSCQSIIAKFNEEVKKSTDSFNAKFMETVGKFGAENNRLTEQVTKIASVKHDLDKATNDVTEINKKVDTLANDLKNSQSAQDVTLENIKANIETLPDSIKSHVDTVELKITNKLLELKNTADEVNNKAAQAIQKLDNIISAIAQATTISKNIQSDIAKLKESVDSEFTAMRSTINVNRWIIIIGIIILVALHFVK